MYSKNTGEGVPESIREGFLEEMAIIAITGRNNST